MMNTHNRREILYISCIFAFVLRELFSYSGILVIHNRSVPNEAQLHAVRDQMNPSSNQPTDPPADLSTHPPTNPPTDLSTHSPTNAPTDLSTLSSTNPPTHSPTDRPTDLSTHSPTDRPTDLSTHSPTDRPKHPPTDHPTPNAERAHKEFNVYVNDHLQNFGGPFCIGNEKIIVSVINDDHEAALRCQLEPQCNTNYSFPTGAFSNAAIIPNALKAGNILFWREDISTYHIFGKHDVAHLEDSPRPPFDNRSEELPLLLDNHVGAHQFGHSMNLFVPLITLLEAEIEEFDNVTVLVDFVHKEYARWKSSVIDSLTADVVLKSSWARKRENNNGAGGPLLLRAPELNANPHNVTCFGNMSMKTISPERYWSHPHEAELFQKAIRRAYPNFAPKTDSCPPPNAIVLYRSGAGAFLRKIRNYDAVEEALLYNGIQNYTNVTVAQDTPIEEVIDLFGSAGLIISTHSSQLKLLVFAHPDTVVVEVRSTDMAIFPNPFGVGIDVVPIHYMAHNVHQAVVDCATPEICETWARKGNVYADVMVNTSRLASSIAEGLKLQEKRCPIW